MITSQEMRNLEEASGVSRIVLMENAGKWVYRIIKERIGIEQKRILIVCYHGYNGGDGFVAARYLSEESEVDVLFIGDENKLKKESLANFKKIEHNGRIQFLVDEEVNFDDYDIIVDAILGIGIHGRLKHEIVSILDKINESKAYKVSVDIPTGVDPDTGNVVENFLNADHIITFHDIKKGLEKFADKTVVIDIGLPNPAV